MGVEFGKPVSPCSANDQVAKAEPAVLEQKNDDEKESGLKKMKTAGVDYPTWESLTDGQQKTWRAKHLLAIGETEERLEKYNFQVGVAREGVAKQRREEFGTGDMMKLLGKMLYPNAASKGEAYKKSVTDLTRFYGSCDRLFELGGEKAFQLTVEEFYEGTMNPIMPDNEGNKPRKDARPMDGPSRITREDVKKTGVTFDVFPEKKQGAPFELVKAQSIAPKGCHGLGSRDDLFVKRFGFGQTHGFIRAALTAWSDHYPLELTVDDFWILVLMGITTHVEQNSEKLRSKFVKFKGKKTLEVENNSLSPGNLDNNWDTCVDKWVEMINNNLVTNKLNVQYSTTTRMAQVVERICVMDCCKSFFAYRCGTCCGFPNVTLRGTQEDWQKLEKDVLGAVEELCLDSVKKYWVPALKSVLPKFSECFDKGYKADKHFWDSMIKQGRQGGSGGYSWYSGWFNVFFPYLGSGGINKFCQKYTPNTVYTPAKGEADPHDPWARMNNRNTKTDPKKTYTRGPDTGDFPTGKAVAPVEWKYYGKDIPVELKAGFFGVAQDPKTKALRPALNWVMQDKEKESGRRRGW